jgi:hypothetical protein
VRNDIFVGHFGCVPWSSIALEATLVEPMKIGSTSRQQ